MTQIYEIFFVDGSGGIGVKGPVCTIAADNQEEATNLFWVILRGALSKGVIALPMMVKCHNCNRKFSVEELTDNLCPECNKLQRS
jgi:Zn finger protein HypA/HybF involved in hydrogenase expression